MKATKDVRSDEEDEFRGELRKLWRR